MPEFFLQLLEGLGNAAGWTVAVAILFIAALGFYKGWWVPGFIYIAEKQRGDRAEDAVVVSARTTQQAAVATQAAADAAVAVASQLVGIRADVARLHHSDESA